MDKFICRRQQKSTIKSYINQFKLAQAAISKAKDVTFINITEISRNGKFDKSLQTQDGHHSSAKQYSLWVNTILYGAKDVFEKMQ